MDELLALLGRHWRLLVLYPGGLAALLGLMLVHLLLPARAARQTITPPNAFDVILAGVWLLLLALLPLPRTAWPYSLDLVTYVVLLELPYWLHLLRRELPRPAQRLTPMLNSYPLLALALAALAQAAGSLLVREINRSAGLLHWTGVVAWATALPPLLALGPWQTGDEQTLITTLRQLAHLALLVAIALPAHDDTGYGAIAAGFTLALVALAALHRWWRGSPEHWSRLQPWLVAGLALLVAFLSTQQLWERLR